MHGAAYSLFPKFKLVAATILKVYAKLQATKKTQLEDKENRKYVYICTFPKKNVFIPLHLHLHFKIQDRRLP